MITLARLESRATYQLGRELNLRRSHEIRVIIWCVVAARECCLRPTRARSLGPSGRSGGLPALRCLVIYIILLLLCNNNERAVNLKKLIVAGPFSWSPTRCKRREIDGPQKESAPKSPCESSCPPSLAFRVRYGLVIDSEHTHTLTHSYSHLALSLSLTLYYHYYYYHCTRIIVLIPVT